MEHPGDFNTFRTTDAEKRALDRANDELYETLRCASEVHREVRPLPLPRAAPRLGWTPFPFLCLTHRPAPRWTPQVRAYAQSTIKPGMRLIDFCEGLEEMNRKLVVERGLDVRGGLVQSR